MTLSDTRDEDGKIIPEKLAEFVKARRGEKGDRGAFDATLRSMAGTSKEAPEASSPDDCND